MRRHYIYIILILTGCHSATTIKYPPGGNSYPEHLRDKDTNFYFYPIKDLESRRDSFIDANGFDIFQSAGEPNLSIKPQPVPTFRLTYGVPLGTDYFVVLTPEYITVKIRTNISDECASLPDTNLLTPLERLHFRVLDHNFPIEPDGKRSPQRQHRLDSLGLVYPELHDAKYYSYLYNKITAHKAHCFTFSQRRIKITVAEFDSLVTRINTSGFWQMPYKDESGEVGMDQPGYIMEANTPERYTLIRGLPGVEDSIHPYREAWQQLVKKAGIDSLIHIAWSPPDSPSHPNIYTVQDLDLQEVREELPKRKHKPKH